MDILIKKANVMVMAMVGKKVFIKKNKNNTILKFFKTRKN